MRVSLLAPFVALLATTSAHAAPLDAQIGVSLSGVPVGTILMTIDASANGYSVNGRVKPSALVGLVANSKLDFKANGSLAGARPVPAKSRVDYASSRRAGSVDFTYAGGRLAASEVVPTVEYKEGTVPVTPAQTSDALDTVSALVFPVEPGSIGDGKAVCNRTVPVWDGKTRFDLAMRYVSTSTGKAEGFEGPIYRCAVRYRSVSGHRPWKEEIKFWEANRNIAVDLAQIGDSPVYGMFGFDVSGKIGTARGRAKVWSVK